MIPATTQPVDESSQAQLDAETRVEWVADPDDYDYVRVTVRPLRSPTRKPAPPVGDLVGYAVLEESTEAVGYPGQYYRRVFWVKEHDRCHDPAGTYAEGAPAEAVDPRTVSVGEPGQLTERAWGATLEVDS